MAESAFAELKRRTLVKSLLWRVIGIVWTWVGAYCIIMIVPPTSRNAPIIATLIVIYHHSTRTIMYYFYERIWAAISWGKYDFREGSYRPMSRSDLLIWTFSTLAAVGFIVFLVLFVAPLVTR